MTALDALRRGDLAGSRELRLAGLGLTEFPREVLALADTLEVLDLGNNALTTLPDDVATLTRLRVLFASGNPLRCLPPALGACPALSQIGGRGCGLKEVPAEALPPKLRWLTLTDNHLRSLPAALGERPALQKLMLAGNQLAALPDTLAGAPNLELMRLSANRFAALPPWLVELPKLAWLAWAGNPLDGGCEPVASALVAWSELRVGALLGEGASGRVHAAEWRDRSVALKLFKGAVTSDGLPEHEMDACLIAGGHANLTGALARVVGHPEGRDGLVMPLLPNGWSVLAGPPSLESCSRDVYPPALRFTPAAVVRLATGIAAAAAHLHARGLLHGDLYAHNILWDGEAGDAVLSDFGAASLLRAPRTEALPCLDVLAFGLLLGELVARVPPASETAELEAIQRACLDPHARSRPTMRDVHERLTSL